MNGGFVSASETSFIRRYALANVGGFLCFVPLISLILPQRTAELAPHSSIGTLSQILLAGGIAASLSNIVSGWISDTCLDRLGSRSPVMVGGLVLTLASFMALAQASDASALLWAFVAFQSAFNLLFAPLTALAADHGSDLNKGKLFGILSLALPLAQGAATLLALSPIDTIGQRLLIVSVVATLLLFPLLGGLSSAPHAPSLPNTREASDPAPSEIAQASGRNFALVWVGRILIQCGSVAVGSYLLLHLNALPGEATAGRGADTMLGQILLISLTGAICAGPVAGYWSDRIGRRIPFLQTASLLIALGCLLMASIGDWRGIAAGHMMFSIGLSAFLTIDSAIIAQIVGKRSLRATRLGIVNLTNTLPALLVPGMVLIAATKVPVATGSLFLAVGAAALVSLFCALRINGLK